MNLWGLFISQRKFVRTVIEERKIVPGVIFGFLGSYILALTSFLTRVFSNSTKPNELYLMLIKEPLVSMLYFVVTVIVVSFVARIFKGEDKIVDYFIANGFGGLYSFIFCSASLPIVLVAKFINPDSPNIFLIGLVLFLAFLILVTFAFMVKYSIVSISEVFKLKTGKSILIFIIVMVPLFLIANELWKVE
ncbi:MAG TPA: hypothetical protein PLZ08_05455 [Bacillota bacterium]|nr:hypothetical protein [Bacillota bacterium]HPO97388.1 hypothetical protein [Bacillota bacterium]